MNDLEEVIGDGGLAACGVFDVEIRQQVRAGEDGVTDDGQEQT